MKRIFVGGLGRSGTTIALNALYRHALVYAIPVETKFLVEEDGFADLVVALTDRFSIAGASLAIQRFELLMRRQVTGLEDSKFRLQHALPSAIFEQYDTALDDFVAVIHRWRYFNRPETLLAATRRFVQATFDAEASKSGKQVWVEKTPANIWRIPFLRALWPDCYFVHAARDPRAILLSLMKRDWLPRELVPALTMFQGYATALVQARAQHAGNPRFYEMRLEALVSDTSGVLNALAAFLGLGDFDPKSVEEVRAAIHAYYGSKEPDALRLSERDYELMDEVLMPAVVELGYPPFWERPPAS